MTGPVTGLGPEPSWHIQQVTAGPREAVCDQCKQLGLAGTELLEQGQTHPAVLQNICTFFSDLSINPGSEKH